MDYKYYFKFWLNILSIKSQIVTEKYQEIYAIDYKKLKQTNVKCLIYDMDDTLTDYLGKPNQKTKKLFDVLDQLDFKLAVLSNSSDKRTEELKNIFRKTDVYVVGRSDKPNPAGYREIFEHYRVTPDETAMIGDRVATDLFGAYMAGSKHRILVEPYSYMFSGKKTKLLDRFFRKLEKLFI